MRKLRLVAIFMVLLVVPAVVLAVFVNGGFEDNGGSFDGWTKTTFLNFGLVGAPVPDESGIPRFNGSNIVRTAGGSDQSIIVSATPPETGVDPRLGAAATLKFPKYEEHAARVNGPGTGRNSNTIIQQVTLTSADLDPFDNQFHVRFAYAPVLEDPGHQPHEQPFYYYRLTNITKGIIVDEQLRVSNEPGVPWKPSPINASVLYTDWQLIDITGDSTVLAEGDTVELEVIGAACSLSGHYGYVYVDGVGSFFAGLNITGSAPPQADPGETITYTFRYCNGGNADAENVIVRVAIPDQTTFDSVNDMRCVNVNGVVECDFGTLEAGSCDVFELTVLVDNDAVCSIIQGNYTIEGDGVSPTLGPVLTTSVGDLRTLDLTGPATAFTTLPTVLTLSIDEAPASDLTVNLTYFGPVNGPASVVIPTGDTSVMFSVNTPSPGQASVLATLPGEFCGVSARHELTVSVVIPFMDNLPLLFLTLMIALIGVFAIRIRG